MQEYSVRWVHGHVEVFDAWGKFRFSADTEREAEEEITREAA